MQDKFEKLYESLKTAYNQASFELLDLQKRVLILESEKRQWEAEKIVQSTIIHTAVTKANSTSNGYLEENKRLREEIKRLQSIAFVS